MIEKDLKFDKIEKDNIVFQNFLTEFGKDLEFIHQYFPDINIKDQPIKRNLNYIITPGFLQEFNKSDKLEDKKELFVLLEKLLCLSKINLELTISLDHSSLSLEIGDIYNKIIEEIVPIYLYHNSSYTEKTLNLINEWRESFRKKQMKIEIILPLKGFFLPQTENIRYYTKIFREKNHLKICLCSIPKYKYTSIEIKYSSKLNREFGQLKDLKVLYCISAKGKVPFYNFSNVEHNYVFNFLWGYIKKIAEAISLEGTLLRFGKPFYKFPWWISKNSINLFNFLIPDWINQRYMNNNRNNILIPDIHLITIPFSYKENDNKLLKYRYFVQPDRIFGFSQSDYNPNWELFSGHLIRERSIKKSEFVKFTTYDKISDPNIIQNLYNRLSDTSSQLNFESSSFILDRLLKIGQRDQLEDAILDMSLILESIFLGTGTNTELSYRLKLYASSLLSSNIVQFRIEFDYFDKLYRMRSQIIHGNANWKTKSKGKSNYLKFIEKCYPQFKSLLESKDPLKIYKLDKLIQYELFKKTGQIIRIILEKNIKFPSDFEKEGFFKIFLDSTT